MKKHMVLGALLLTLGTAAAAGSFLYGQQVEETVQIALPSDLAPVSQEASPEVIAMWKATAASTDYSSQKAPI